MDIKTAEKIITECQEVKTKVESAKEVAEAQRDHAETRLAELKKDLPMTLAGLALGEVTQGEADQLWQEITECERVVSDTALALEGLRLRQVRNNQEIAKATKIVRRHEAVVRYAEVKAQLKVKYSKDLDGYLRQAASEVGHEKEREAEDFLREIKKRWEETSLQDRV